MKICIIDSFNQDIGLNILFPEAKYYIYKSDIDCVMSFRLNSCKEYNIIINNDWSDINDINYDLLFIILPFYDIKKHQILYNNIKDILLKNNFKKVIGFDNYDYDYDPNDYIKDLNINYFFKRNYNKTKYYKKNVFPFPFIMFGHISLIEKCDKDKVSMELYLKPKIDRVFFTGTIFNHEDTTYNIYRNRFTIYNKICHSIYNPGRIEYNDFMYNIRNSKYSLDLLGVGEPNKRTIEILISGSLILSEKNNLKWPFDDNFSEETIFNDSDDFFIKLNNLQKDTDLYNKCLLNQYNIVNKYFNKQWLRYYIINTLLI